MMRKLLILIAFFCSTAGYGSDPQWCSQQAQQAYNQAYNDCMGGSAGQCRFDADCQFGYSCRQGRCEYNGGNQPQACDTYTVHGEYACREHSACNWSYTSSACYDKNGQYCAYYTRHGEYACRDNSSCGWSYSASACYDKAGQYCEYYTQYGEYACRDNRACDWSYQSNACFSR